MMLSYPAKTFAVGEYAALLGGSALILTTKPCFSLQPTALPGLHGMSTEAPAARWWQAQQLEGGWQWCDPWHGLGGLGASSAQFLAVYQLYCQQKSLQPSWQAMLQDYEQVAWSGQGARPSGYDVLAQTQWGCVMINRRREQLTPVAWPFVDLGFFLVHTGQKLPTHEHLRALSLPDYLPTFSQVAQQACDALVVADRAAFVQAIANYGLLLQKNQLVCAHVGHQLRVLAGCDAILAAKGCGALGADIILILCDVGRAGEVRTFLQDLMWQIVADQHDLLQESDVAVRACFFTSVREKT